MKKKQSGVYQILNKSNGKYYVGSSSDIKRRFIDHKKLLRNNKHDNGHLQNAWNLYGEGMFEFVIMKVLPPVKSILLEEEQNQINILQACNREMGYNILPTAYSNLGHKHSEETKTKISQRRGDKFRVLPDDDLINLSKPTPPIDKGVNSVIKDETNPFFGKKHNEDSKQIMREKKIGRKNHFFGSGPMLGKILTDEHKQKISVGNTGKNNKNSKPILQYDLEMNFITEWESSGVIINKLKLGSSANIRNCCNGITKTSYGYVWRYK